MQLTRTEEALLLAAYYRGRDPLEKIWTANSGQVVTLSLDYTGELSSEECATRFEERPYLRGLYDQKGQLKDEIRRRSMILIELINRRPDLIRGAGNLKPPTDPTYTACGLTAADHQLAVSLRVSFPRKPEFPHWPDRQDSLNLKRFVEDTFDDVFRES